MLPHYLVKRKSSFVCRV